LNKDADKTILHSPLNV